MVRVAIAGGTGKLGKTIAEVLSQNPKHNVFVLTRKPTTLPRVDAPVCVVDDKNVDGLTKLLEENAIEVIISTIPVATAEASEMEINLVRAASQSRPTKRFIASQWAIPVPNPRLHLPNQKYLDATIDELKTTELEWTTIYNGYFMDFFGTPHVKSNMGIFAIHIDMASKVAAIPGTGDEKISFTYTYDIAKFVDAALDLQEWQQSLFCYGDVRTYNEVLKLAEKYTGAKFTVTYDSREKLERAEMTELPFHTQIYSLRPKAVLQHRFSRFGLCGIDGFYIPPSDGTTLNDRFPHIKTTTVADMMATWKGR